jgi:phosphoserine phosphatase
VRRYASVVLDADSTLVGIEGIDWLAARRDQAIQQQVESLTTRTMDGDWVLDDVYPRRIELIRPTTLDLRALSHAYVAALAPGAADAVAALQAAGIAVHVISGGLRTALLPMTRTLGIGDECVHAVDLLFDAEGRYQRLVATPLVTQGGKAVVLEQLHLRRPMLAVGDGSTDLAMASIADTFAAYIGFVRRDPVVARASLVLDSFAALVAHALSA